MQKNTQLVGLWIGLLIALAGCLLMTVPGLIGLDMMQVGYGMGFVGLFVVITGGLVAFLYYSRVRIMQSILDEPEAALAHWYYRQDEWQTFADAEFAREQGEKLPILWVIAGISLVVGVGFVIADPEAGVWVAGVLAGLLVLLAAFAFGVPRLNYRHNRDHPGEAIITPDAVYLSGRLHTWKQWGGQLDGVSWLEDTMPMLVFDISYPSRYGRQVTSVRVPIPTGEYEAARLVLEQFTSPHAQPRHPKDNLRKSRRKNDA